MCDTVHDGSQPWAYGLKPHILFYEVVSVIRWVIPYKYLTILEILLKLIKLCGEMGKFLILIKFNL